MRKYWYRRFLIIILVFTITMGSGMLLSERAGQREVSVESLSDDLLIPGGMPVGIYMETDGVMVLGTEKIKAADGKSYEPADRLVRTGDYIIGIGKKDITNKKQLLEEVGKIRSDDVVLRLRRGEDKISVKIKPVKCREDYKLGIWVRDNTQGLGTVTFLTKNSEYGALGHGIHDVDTGKLLDISKGTLYETSIRDIKKGTEGNPGGMEGIIVYNNYNILGTIEKNTDTGIYGTVEKINTLFEDQTPMKAAKKEEIRKGNAKIRCTIDGAIQEYDVRITKIDLHEKELNKGIELEVTDERLLEKTGGIVQGMSGSPIIQNNKIIGAVTHVFVQDAAKGYGIFIENMMKNVE